MPGTETSETPETPEPAERTAWPPVCHRCGSVLTPGDGSFYVVRIEAVADPSPPRDEDDVLSEAAPRYEELIEAMKDLSEQELMDQVYRRVTLLLCRRCYQGWIENPVG